MDEQRPPRNEGRQQLPHSEGELTLSQQSQPDAPNTSPPPEPAKPVTYRQLLSNPNFRLLWLGQAITTFGSSLTRVAIPIYVFQLTSSYTQLGLSFFASFVPALLFGLFAGAFVDRWDRRRTMIYTDLLSGLLLAVLVASAFMPLSQTVHLGVIYSVIFLSALLRELFSPARIAIFTDVVPERQLLTANSLDQSTFMFGELLAFPLASMALLYLGAEVAFSIDAASFVLSALLIWGVKVHSSKVERDSSETTSIWQEIGEGLAIINTIPILRKIVVLSLFVPFTFMLLGTLQLPYTVDVLKSTEEIGFPALEAAMSLGLVVGTLLLGRWGQHVPRWKLVGFGLLSFGLVVVAIGLVPQIGAFLQIPESPQKTPWSALLFIALPLIFLQGATNSLIFTSTRTIMQEKTPRAAVGRVSSTIGMVSSIGFSAAGLFTGLAENRVDTVIILVGLGLVITGVFSLWWLRTPPSRAEQLVQTLPEQSF
jgi:MFS family permease